MVRLIERTHRVSLNQDVQQLRAGQASFGFTLPQKFFSQVAPLFLTIQMSSNAAQISEGALGSFMKLSEDKKLILRLQLELNQRMARKNENLQVIMETTLLQYHG